MATTPLTTAELQPLVAPDPWNDAHALKIVTADVETAGSDKTKNIDPKIQQGDELYISNPKVRKWDSTNLLRASVNIHLVYEQVNAIVPHIISALFGDPNHLDVDPRFGTNYDQAAAVKHLLQYQMDDLSDEMYISLREIILRQVMDALIYCNGIIEFGWLVKKVNKCIYERQQSAEPVMANGQLVDIQPKTVVTKKEVDVNISRPFVRNVDLKRFFIDPNCTSSNIQDAAYVYTDEFMDVEDLEGYRGQEGFNIPDRETLLKWASAKPARMGDNDTQFQDSLRTISSNPQVDQSKDPAKARVLVYRYWQKNRHVWMIKSDGKDPNHLAYNQRNKYNAIPFLNFCYSPLPGRFWGLGLSELLRSDQKTIEDLVNNRLDQENLWMFPPMIKPRGVTMPSSMFRTSPGRIWEGKKDDYTFLERPQPNAEAFAETQQIYLRVEKKTGASSLSVLGSPAAGGNSATRTATGVATQAAATSTRLMHLVENIEGQVLAPLYSAFLGMNQAFMDPNQALQVMSQEGESLTIDPVDVFNASVRFRIKSSTKMRAKFVLQQMLPMLWEMGLNPAFLQQLGMQQGMTADMKQWTELLCNAMDVEFRALYRQMTPQEQQALNQPSPDQMLGLQKQRERLQSQQEVQREKDDTSLIKGTTEAILKHPGVIEAVTGVKPPAKEKTSGSGNRKSSK
jgi:hypothetical protein